MSPTSLPADLVDVAAHRVAGPMSYPIAAPEPVGRRVRKAHASPGVRAFARHLGVDLLGVTGSGPNERVLVGDVQAFVRQALADLAKYGPVEATPLSRIKRISGANLARNWVMIPHVTQHDDADITSLEAFRQQVNRENESSGNKVTMLAFLVKAVVAALKRFPDFNASLDGDQLVHKQYFHVGFAAETPNGLVVPVIRNAERKGVLQIAEETSAMAALARDGKLGPADMQGGCFSISSLGGIGGTYFTPIINAPEVAILGVSKAQVKPVWDGKEFQPRLMLPLSLSYDHRVIDGAAAARFTMHVSTVLADLRRTLV